MPTRRPAKVRDRKATDISKNYHEDFMPKETSSETQSADGPEAKKEAENKVGSKTKKKLGEKGTLILLFNLKTSVVLPCPYLG